MNLELPDDVVAFGQSVRRRLDALGGVRAALAAETDDSLRAAFASALDELGASDIDARGEDLVAAAELCRVVGAVAAPFPVVDHLLARDGRRLALVDPAQPLVDHGDLSDEWLVADLGGSAWHATTGSRRASKLGPFVVRATLGESADAVSSDDVARHLTLGSWRILGSLETTLALAKDHVSSRRQFGQTLSEFQVVRFSVADTTVAVRGLTELAKYTVWRLGVTTPEVGLADALALRVHADDTARAVLRACHQLLGALGFCDEHDISVVDRHLQPALRLPHAAEALVERLVPQVRDGNLESLFTRAPQVVA